MTPFRLLFEIHPRTRDYPDVQELLQRKLIISFESDRDELRSEARKSIEHVQRDNKRSYDARRKRHTVIEMVISLQFAARNKDLDSSLHPNT